MHIRKFYTSSTNIINPVNIDQIINSLEEAKTSVSANPYNLFLSNSGQIKKNSIQQIILALTNLKAGKDVYYDALYSQKIDTNLNSILKIIHDLSTSNLKDVPYQELNSLIKSYLGKHRISFFKYIKQTNSIKAYEDSLRVKNIVINEAKDLINSCNLNNLDEIYEKSNRLNDLLGNIRSDLCQSDSSLFIKEKSVIKSLIKKFINKIKDNPEIKDKAEVTMVMLRKFYEHISQDAFMKFLKRIQRDHPQYIFNFSEWKLSDLIFDASLNMSNFQFNNSILNNIIFESCNLNNISFNNSTLTNVKFKKCVMHSVDFENSVITICDFINCQMNNYNFGSVTYKIVEFQKSKLENITFSSCNMRGISFNGSKLNKIQIEKSELYNSSFYNAAITDINNFVEQLMINGNTYGIGFIKLLVQQVENTLEVNQTIIDDQDHLDNLFLDWDKYDKQDQAQSIKKWTNDLISEIIDKLEYSNIKNQLINQTKKDPIEIEKPIEEVNNEIDKRSGIKHIDDGRIIIYRKNLNSNAKLNKEQIQDPSEEIKKEISEGISKYVNKKLSAAKKSWSNAMDKIDISFNETKNNFENWVNNIKKKRK